MTKQHSSTVTLIAGLVGISLLVPSFALAQDKAKRVTRVENFCTKIDTATQSVGSGIATREGKYKEKRDEVHKKMETRHNTRDEKRVDNRAGWDAQRGEWFGKLSAKATTTAQKAAVEKFFAAIDVAVAARRGAVDSAVKSYRSALDAAVLARQSAVDAAIETLKQETNAALLKAKADCGASVDPKTVRSAYTTALKLAREKFRATTKTIDARKDTLSPIANSRKLAIEKAVTDFKTAVEKARMELKSALAIR